MKAVAAAVKDVQENACQEAIKISNENKEQPNIIMIWGFIVSTLSIL